MSMKPITGVANVAVADYKFLSAQNSIPRVVQAAGLQKSHHL